MPTATLTSKGQLTLPKSVREQAGAQTGDKLDVSVSVDGTIHLRKLGGRVEDLAGLLASGPRARTVEEMDDAIVEHLVAEDERIRSGR